MLLISKMKVLPVLVPHIFTRSCTSFTLMNKMLLKSVIYTMNTLFALRDLFKFHYFAIGSITIMEQVCYMSDLKREALKENALQI